MDMFWMQMVAGVVGVVVACVLLAFLPSGSRRSL